MTSTIEADAGFTSAALMQQAQEATGLDDWGSDDSFRTGLEVLLASVDAMAGAPQLRPAIAAQSLHILTTRLRLEDDAKRHPDILEGRIVRPLIVAGLPRTGTSWLFELLALDPACRAPLEWEAALPWPAPELATFATDPRIAMVQAGVDAMLAAGPELATMHEFGALLPAECNSFMQFHFATSNFWATYGVPDYIEWLTMQRPKGTFTTHRRILQQLQWKGPRGRWMLKSPPYMLMIDELLEAYPDACIVQTHREPAKTVASLANLLRALRRARMADVPGIHDPKDIARSVLFHFGEALERGTQSRQNPEVDKHFYDVAFRDLIGDPTPVIKAIYAHFDLPYTQAFEDRLQAHLAIPRTTGHGAHKYDEAEYGIADLDLPSRFPSYRARFGQMLSDKA